MIPIYKQASITINLYVNRSIVQCQQLQAPYYCVKILIGGQQIYLMNALYYAVRFFCYDCLVQSSSSSSQHLGGKCQSYGLGVCLYQIGQLDWRQNVQSSIVKTQKQRGKLIVFNIQLRSRLYLVIQTITASLVQ